MSAALAVEWCFLAAPSLADGWERRGVPFLAAAGFVGLALVAAFHFPWLLAAAAWGLLTSLCLLGCVLVGWGNPVAWLG